MDGIPHYVTTEANRRASKAYRLRLKQSNPEAYKAKVKEYNDRAREKKRMVEERNALLQYGEELVRKREQMTFEERENHFLNQRERYAYDEYIMTVGGY